MLYFETKGGNVVKNKEDLFNLFHKDGKWVIKKWRDIRTLDQNRYYRALLGIVENETGQDADTIHEKMAMKFLFVPGNGKELPYCKSTTMLDTKEMGEYIEKIRMFFLNILGIKLPDANEFNNFITK